jgi:hypothetical protein
MACSWSSRPSWSQSSARWRFRSSWPSGTRACRQFRELGPKNLKNIAKPVEVFAISCAGAGQTAFPASAFLNQHIGYCRAHDGVRLAYAKVGRGSPLLTTVNWFNHLESPIRGHILRAFANDRTRGNGLSDWEVDELSLDAWVRDLEKVVDAVGVHRFALLGISQGCAISIAYAVRHPERVSHLILYGGFALGTNRRSAAASLAWFTTWPTFEAAPPRQLLAPATLLSRTHPSCRQS